MKLLLAEDERQAGEHLVKGPSENGWVVDGYKTESTQFTWPRTSSTT
jgi:hypothetical protein